MRRYISCCYSSPQGLSSYPRQHIKLCRAFIITITTFLENDSEIGIAGIFNGARGFVDLILETRFRGRTMRMVLIDTEGTIFSFSAPCAGEKP